MHAPECCQMLSFLCNLSTAEFELFYSNTLISSNHFVLRSFLHTNLLALLKALWDYKWCCGNNLSCTKPSGVCININNCKISESCFTDTIINTWRLLLLFSSQQSTHSGLKSVSKVWQYIKHLWSPFLVHTHKLYNSSSLKWPLMCLLLLQTV